MTDAHSFHPTWVSAPGETIAKVLRERDLSLEEFSKNIERSAEDINALIRGELAITTELAQSLSTVIGSTVTFWINREAQYQQDMERLRTEAKRAVDTGWLTDLPVSDMAKFGWLSSAHSKADKAAACLRFFGVPNHETWSQVYSRTLEIVAFRTSNTFDSKPPAVAAWLRQGELISASIKCDPWNPTRFKESLQQIRKLTFRKDPTIFIPKLINLCAKAGVAIAIVRSPQGCRASGATRFVDPKRAILQLSVRHLSNDHFWFTFYHEAGHLLLHSKKTLFLEEANKMSSKEEEEANNFASDFLIPKQYREDFLKLGNRPKAIIGFAQKVGIAPGIVVGQLQHIGKLEHHQLNYLKRRYSWV